MPQCWAVIAPFKSAVVVIKPRLGRGGLVTQLRESDINGAPLAFQAAGGVSAACFESVSKVMHKTLGRNELRQQVQAVDLKERSIIFHAPKSQAANVFQAVIRAFDGDGGGCPRNTDTGDQTEDPRKSWLLADDLPESPAPEHKKRQAIRSICGRNVFVDYTGMTALHVTCPWGCPDIVEMILKEASKQGQDSVQDFLRIVDNSGRTALMHAVRHDHGIYARELDSVCLILGALVDRANNTAYPEKLGLFTQPASPKFDSSALMYAAYGGPKRLEVLQDYICSLVQNVQHDPATNPCHAGLHLEFALGIEHESPEKNLIDMESCWRPQRVVAIPACWKTLLMQSSCVRCAVRVDHRASLERAKER
ncbi:hypothetical protein Esi_0176_0047 [Ectocarpus siliculosus]|uniref:Uncharacterized protein n=1 Tax=Ectocarpus siliculosus TaxID=2880 RepID=D8LGS3_ECTSI|nr:hypothetical protein Esi_0176_0047 [Ectocarpus siliculosus]|eukprot:CBN79093.1 hypothetical protein Esi_0176_0047 [Ectocarpus siliculosus]